MVDSDPSQSVDWHQYEADLLELCQVKAEEFRLLGYAEVTAADIWTCVRAMHRKSRSLHELVSGVLGLQVGKFMNYTTVNAFKGIFDGGQDDALEGMFGVSRKA